MCNGVKDTDVFHGHIGFNFSDSSSGLEYDKKTYPYDYLDTLHQEEFEEPYLKKMKTH